MARNPIAPLSDAIIVAISQLVDDAQADHRDPSHSDLDFEIKRAGLTSTHCGLASLRGSLHLPCTS